MRIAIGADHRGYQYKEKLKEHLITEEYTVTDCGTFSEDMVDYPEFTKRVADSVASGESEFGIMLCGSGIGVSIMANKIKGIRAALVMNEEMSVMARHHNNANMICLGSDFMDYETAEKCSDIFLKSEFEGGRHLRRIEQIHTLTGL
jgi:ribose 5-phosphate isomerase B